MGIYPQAVERTMKAQEVTLKPTGQQIQSWHAAEVLGANCSTTRHWKQRPQEHGYDALFDGRLQQPSPKRVPVATVQTALRLHRRRYRDFNVPHFPEQLVSKHGIAVSYTWVKAAPQMAGLVVKDGHVSLFGDGANAAPAGHAGVCGQQFVELDSCGDTRPRGFDGVRGWCQRRGLSRGRQRSP